MKKTNKTNKILKHKIQKGFKSSATYLDDNLAPRMSALGSNKHLLAMRNGIVSTLPFIIVGSLFLIILNFPLGEDATNNVGSKMPPHLKTYFLGIYYLSMGSVGIFAAFGIGASLGKSYKLNSMLSGTMSLFAFLLWFDYQSPVGRTFGGTTLFTAMISSLIAVEIFRMCVKLNITIRMPSQVPKAISDTFLTIIPVLIIALLFGSFRYLLNFDLTNFLKITLAPMQDFLINGLIGNSIMVFMIGFLWIFGIHGSSILNSIVRPFWIEAIEENGKWLTEGASGSVPNLYPEQFQQWFLWIGGGGTTLGLLIVILAFGKSKQTKAIAKTSIAPGLFNINEPVIFGMPIVLNPILMFLFLFTPVILVFVSGLWMQIFNIYFVAVPPWTMPTPIGALLASNMNPWAFITCLNNLFIACLIYLPFALKYDKQKLIEENPNLTMDEINKMIKLDNFRTKIKNKFKLIKMNK